MPILYKYAIHLTETDSAEFDKKYAPGMPAPHSGIYRCAVCGREATSLLSRPLPPKNHHAHPRNQPIEWQLVVWA